MILRNHRDHHVDRFCRFLFKENGKELNPNLYKNIHKSYKELYSLVKTS